MKLRILAAFVLLFTALLVVKLAVLFAAPPPVPSVAAAIIGKKGASLPPAMTPDGHGSGYFLYNQVDCNWNPLGAPTECADPIMYQRLIHAQPIRGVVFRTKCSSFEQNCFTYDQIRNVCTFPGKLKGNCQIYATPTKGAHWSYFWLSQ